MNGESSSYHNPIIIHRNPCPPSKLAPEEVGPDEPSWSRANVTGEEPLSLSRRLLLYPPPSRCAIPAGVKPPGNRIFLNHSFFGASFFFRCVCLSPACFQPPPPGSPLYVITLLGLGEVGSKSMHGFIYSSNEFIECIYL